MSLDSSDSETQPEGIFTTKDIPALENKVQLIETQTMSTGFENLGSLFLTSNGRFSFGQLDLLHVGISVMQKLRFVWNYTQSLALKSRVYLCYNIYNFLLKLKK